MPISFEFPYHITARTNNKEWFSLSLDECWDIFSSLLQEITIKFHFKTHAFLLMSNHYHLIGTASVEHPLPRVMEWFQRSSSRKICQRANRINHLYGGPYRASLIHSDLYYYHAYKYVLRNPVEANLVERVENYKFNSLHNCLFPIFEPCYGLNCFLPKKKGDVLKWLNEAYSEEAKEQIKKSLQKKEFRFSKRLKKKTSMELLVAKRYDVPFRKGTTYLFTPKWYDAGDSNPGPSH